MRSAFPVTGALPDTGAGAGRLMLRRPGGAGSMGGDVLNQVVLTYSPVIDRRHAIVATRLSVLPLAGAARLDAKELLNIVAQVWPAGYGDVWLNISHSEQLLHDVMKASPPPNVALELPAFMATDPAQASTLRDLHARGVDLLIKGRPLAQVPPDVLALIRHVIVDLDEERRHNTDAVADPPPQEARRIGFVQAGVRRLADAQSSFDRGAVALLGWPTEDMAPPADGETRQPLGEDVLVLIETIGRVECGDDLEHIDRALRHHPNLLHRLMRYAKSPVLGLPLGVTAFRPAVLMLGYQRLRRCLALLMVTASKDSQLRPLIFGSVRRALMMERLAGDDENMRHEMFLCGALSLMDRVLGRPLRELLTLLPVPEQVHAALIDNAGPYASYCELARVAEDGDRDEACTVLEALRLSPGESNHALLRALAASVYLE